MRLAIVGVGAIAQAHAAAIAAAPGVELVFAVDPRPEAAAAMAEAHDATALASCEELVARAAQVDGAIVCTPPSTHEEVSGALLRAGLHVLCEKPLAITSDAAARMVAGAHAAGRSLVMASKFRYVDDLLKAKAMIASGAIGAPISFENAFTSRVSMAGRWNADPGVSGGGVVIDNGTHSVDIARFLFGPVVEVLAVEARRLQAISVEDSATMLVRTAAGVTGSIDLSWSIDKRQQDWIRIHGAEGTIAIGWAVSAVRRSSAPDWEPMGHGYDKVAAFAAVLADFVGAATEGRPARIGVADALASVYVIEAAHRSLRRVAWEPVEGATLST